MEYRLTTKGTNAEIRPTLMGKILELMQGGKGVVNPDEINYEFNIDNSNTYLDSLVRAGYLAKQEEDKGSGIGGF